MSELSEPLLKSAERSDGDAAGGEAADQPAAASTAQTKRGLSPPTKSSIGGIGVGEGGGDGDGGGADGDGDGGGSGGGVGQAGGGSAFASGHRYGLSRSSPLTHPVEWHFVPLQHVRE